MSRDDPNKNEEELLVSFFKDGVGIETLVWPLRYDEAVSMAKAKIMSQLEPLGVEHISKYLDVASATISTARKFK